MCALRGGASRCLSLRARAWVGGSGADAPARCALPGGAVLRLAAHGRGAAARRRPGRSPSGAPADASDGLGGAGAQAGHQPAGAGPSDLSLLIARADDRAAKPSVGRRHHLYPDGPRLFLLVAIIDWFSRAVLAWRLSNTMDALFCVEALEVALARFGESEIFSSDQGAQFTSAAFTTRLEAAGIAISMDGRGRWLDNVFVERLWRSL